MKWRMGVLSGLVAGCVLAATAMAGEGAAAKPLKPKPEGQVQKPHVPEQPLETLTLTGKLGKGEQTKRDKNGNQVPVTFFTLTQDDGTIVRLPQGKIKQADGTVIELEALMGRQVTVTGEGRTGEKNGKKWIKLAKMASLVEVPPPAVPPAATK